MESLKTTEMNVARTRAAFRNAEVEAVFEKARYDLKRRSGTVLVAVRLGRRRRYGRFSGAWSGMG